MPFKRRSRRRNEGEADVDFIMLSVLTLKFIAGRKLAVQRNVNKRVSQLDVTDRLTRNKYFRVKLKCEGDIKRSVQLKQQIFPKISY